MGKASSKNVSVEEDSLKKTLCYFVNVDWYFELHWLSRAKAAIADGWTVHLICGVTSGSAIRAIENTGVLCHAVPFRRGSVNPVRLLRTFFSVRALVKEIRPDVMHCITTVANLSGGLIARSFHIPVILTIPGTGWVFSSISRKAKLLRKLVILWYRTISKSPNVQYVFENYDDEILFRQNRMLGKSKSSVILGAGVDTDLYRPASVPSKKSDLHFIFAGRLLYSKGLGDLLQAGKMLYEQGCNFKIIVCGLIDKDSPDAVLDDDIISWQTLPFVNWLGPQKGMHLIFQTADVAVLPTLYGEGVPRFLIEAASCGLALLASDMPGCREVVHSDENGILIPAGDISSLANAMRYLIDNPLICEQYGYAGRKLILSDFDQIYVNAATLDMYRDFAVAIGVVGCK